MCGAPCEQARRRSIAGYYQSLPHIVKRLSRFDLSHHGLDNRAIRELANCLDQRRAHLAKPHLQRERQPIEQACDASLLDLKLRYCGDDSIERCGDERCLSQCLQLIER